jgi:hypothetical protein
MCRHQTSRKKFLSAENSLPVSPQSSVFFKKTFPRKFLPEVPYQEACPINQQCKRKLVPQEVDCHPCAIFV